MDNWLFGLNSGPSSGLDNLEDCVDVLELKMSIEYIFIGTALAQVLRKSRKALCHTRVLCQFVVDTKITDETVNSLPFV